MTKRRLFSALTVFLFIFISVTSLLPSDLNAQTSKVWVEGYWEDVTENVWVKSGYNTHTWVDTSHWENQNVWVNTSHWQWVSSGYSKNVWVESGYWKSVWVDTSHNVWVENGYFKDTWVNTSHWESVTEKIWVEGYWVYTTPPTQEDPETTESNLGTGENTVLSTEPINVVTGNYYSVDIDLSIADIGLPLEISRYYNSLDTREGIIGKGWRLSYESTIEVDSTSGDAKVTYPDGHTLVFEYNEATSQYTCAKAPSDRLTANEDGSYSLRTGSRLTYNYESSGRLASVADNNHNKITLAYDTDGNLVSITAMSGKCLALTSEDGRIKTIADESGRTIEYSYDTGGNLTCVKDAGGGEINYEYNSLGLTSITDENGRKFVVNEYDEFGRVTSQLDEEGNQIKIIYDDENMENSYTQVAAGRTERYKYNEKLYVTKKTFDDGTYEEYTYDNWGNKDSIKDRNGSVTRYTFDARANMTSVISSAPYSYITTYIYDDNDNLTGIITPGGASTDLEYDLGGNLIKATIKLDETSYASTSYTYDSCGRLLSKVDAEGNVTTFAYSGNPSPVKVTDPQGNITSYSYDELERMTSVTTSYGTTTFTYNKKDKIEKITDPLGNTTRMKYDLAGNLVKLIKPQQYDPSSDDGPGYTYDYDGMDRLVRQIDPLSAVVAFKYDADGNKIKEINPNYYDPAADDGLGIGYSYNESGRLINIINPSGEQSRIKYDPAGNIIETIDANSYDESADSGPGMQYTYDKLNRLVEVKDTSGSIVKRYVYDPDGRIVKEIDAKGYLSGTDDDTRYGTVYKYNLAGWLIEKRDPLKLESGILYYAITRYTYDKEGRMLEQKTSPDYVTITGEPSVWNTITYTYYKNGRVKTVSDSTGAYMEYTYDELGNTTYQKAKINEDKYSMTGYQYDAAGRLIKKWDEVDAEDLKEGGTGKILTETIFEYDRNGNIIKVIRPEGYETTFQYDDMDRLVSKNEEVESSNIELKRTTALVSSPREIFYPAMQYEFEVEMSSDEAVGKLSMEIEYDARIFEPSGSEPASGINIDTDTIGKIMLSGSELNYSGDVTLATLRFKIKEGITGIGFITISPTSTYTSTDGIQYKFSELTGEVANIKEPDINGDGRVEADDFTLVARLVGVKVGDTEYEEKYDIDASGTIDTADLDYLKDILFSDSSMQLEELNTANFIERWTNAAYIAQTSAAVRTTEYKYDKAGNLTGETDTNGNTVTYSYDAYNRLISVTDKSGATSRLYYDEQGRRIKEILPQNYNPDQDNGLGTTYSYDTMGRLAEIKDALGSVMQKNIYDTGGLIISSIDATGYGLDYAYDAGGRIATVTSPESKLKGKESGSYTYDGQGSIVSFTDGEGNTEIYSKDMWGKTTRVVDPYGVETLYGYDYAGNITSTTDGNGNVTLYSYNSINLLSSMTDPLGQSAVYKYDREGRLVCEEDRNGSTTLYSYNRDNNLTSKNIEGKDEDENYLYNKDGSLLAAINSSYVDQYEYTPNGLIDKKIRNGKSILDYEYDKNGNIINVTDGSGMSTGYTYDTLGRIETVLDGATPIATYSYNPDSTIADIDYITGINVSYTYDRDKNIISLENKDPEGGIIDSFSYTYDNNGNQLTKEENDLVTTYTYDKLDRLVSAGTEIYNYDSAGNRTRKINGTEITSYSYGTLNRLTRSETNGAATAYSYDSNGNLLKTVEGQKETLYTYDSYNRLKEVATPDGAWMLNVYDPSGLRSAVVEDSSRYEFTFDRGSVIEETEADGSLAAKIYQGDRTYCPEGQ